MEWAVRQVSSFPRLVLWTCLAILIAISVAAIASGSRSGFLAALCAPGLPKAGMPVFAMWTAMTLVMMLPAGAPMLSVYLDIAETAREKSIAVVSPLILAGGYIAVWLAAAAAGASLQIMLGPLPAQAAGPILIAAGLYQFGPLKHACLTKCRQPMPFFMSRWTTRPLGIFRLGAEQGLLCLGCCWALMVLSLVAGAMNPVWMAAIGLLAIFEKTLPQPKPLIYGAGLGLAAAGSIMIALT
ncbi:hypothetical protein BH10PSE7_BH10PSE7_26160 [soil metagenome]